LSAAGGNVTGKKYVSQCDEHQLLNTNQLAEAERFVTSFQNGQTSGEKVQASTAKGSGATSH